MEKILNEKKMLLTSPFLTQVLSNTLQSYYIVIISSICMTARNHKEALDTITLYTQKLFSTLNVKVV